jgi:sugar phosphate isomerase/epimerase
VRGITVSTHTDGRDWASPEIRSTFEDIRALGADWVAIHPYAGIWDDGTIRFRPIDPADPPDEIAQPIREAHAAGLKILIIPHVAYWGSRFSWRGDIAFSDSASWNRFFTTYRAWISSVARAAQGADGFSVGNELDGTVSHEAEWRRVIAAVRANTPAALTYAANWSHYRDVPFWDALDAIGIEAYFPVSRTPDPGEGTLAASWAGIMKDLHAFAIEHDRKIVFTELGYTRAHDAPMRPWDDATDGMDAEATQARCLKVALRAIQEEPEVVGVFLWKWFPNPYPVGRNFQLATPVMKQVIAEAWDR